MLSDIGPTLLQSVVSIAVLFILSRLMGKKQVSQLTFFDYVSGISIGSIAASFAVDSSINYIKGITGLIVFAAFPILLSYISQKSYKARKLLDGKPTVLVSNGEILEKNLRKSQLNVNDLLEECRQKNVFNIMDVEFAILETDGKLSVEIKSPMQPLTPKDMNIQTQYKGLCANVIMDGKIMNEQLDIAGKDRKWLVNELTKKNIAAEYVLLGYVDNSGQLMIQKKNDYKPGNPLM